MKDDKLHVLRQVVEKGFEMADMDAIEKYVCEDVIEHQFGRASGRETLKKSILSLAEAFSERKYKLIQFTVVGDKVWGHYEFSGVHTGTFFGNEASGNKVRINVMDIVVVKNNQIVEHWGIPDRLALLMQIGAINMNK